MKKLSIIITLLTLNLFAADVWQSVIKGTFYQDSGLGVSYQVILNDEKISEGQVTIGWSELNGKSQTEKDTLINARVFEASEAIKAKYESVKGFEPLKDVVAVKDGKNLNDEKQEIMAVKYVEPVEVKEEVVQEVKTEAVSE